MKFCISVICEYNSVYLGIVLVGLEMFCHKVLKLIYFRGPGLCKTFRRKFALKKEFPVLENNMRISYFAQTFSKKYINDTLVDSCKLVREV